jgi:hypothetical protein
MIAVCRRRPIRQTPQGWRSTRSCERAQLASADRRIGLVKRLDTFLRADCNQGGRENAPGRSREPARLEMPGRSFGPFPARIWRMGRLATRCGAVAGPRRPARNPAAASAAVPRDLRWESRLGHPPSNSHSATKQDRHPPNARGRCRTRRSPRAPTSSRNPETVRVRPARSRRNGARA